MQLHLDPVALLLPRSIRISSDMLWYRSMFCTVVHTCVNLVCIWKVRIEVFWYLDCSSLLDHVSRECPPVLWVSLGNLWWKMVAKVRSSLLVYPASSLSFILLLRDFRVVTSALEWLDWAGMAAYIGFDYVIIYWGVPPGKSQLFAHGTSVVCNKLVPCANVSMRSRVCPY